GSWSRHAALARQSLIGPPPCRGRRAGTGGRRSGMRPSRPSPCRVLSGHQAGQVCPPPADQLVAGRQRLPGDELVVESPDGLVVAPHATDDDGAGLLSSLGLAPEVLAERLQLGDPLAVVLAAL